MGSTNGKSKRMCYQLWANALGYPVKCEPWFEFAFDYDDDIIFIGCDEIKAEDVPEFVKLLNDLGYAPKTEIPLTVMAFLHELGHFVTIFDDEEDYQVHQIINTLFDIADDESDKHHFYLPLERKATKWAVDFVNEHWADVYALVCQLESIDLWGY